MGALLKLRDEGGPLPASVVLWSPWADITETGDSYITLAEEDPQFRYRDFLAAAAYAYADEKDHKNPWVSSVYADFSSGFPKTLIQAGTREIFLSNSVRLYRALKDAGCQVELDLFEGMWHAFQFQPVDMPEARRARAHSIQFMRDCWKAANTRE